MLINSTMINKKSKQHSRFHTNNLKSLTKRLITSHDNYLKANNKIKGHIFISGLIPWGEKSMLC